MFRWANGSCEIQTHLLRNKRKKIHGKNQQKHVKMNNERRKPAKKNFSSDDTLVSVSLCKFIFLSFIFHLNRSQKLSTLSWKHWIRALVLGNIAPFRIVWFVYSPSNDMRHFHSSVHIHRWPFFLLKTRNWNRIEWKSVSNRIFRCNVVCVAVPAITDSNNSILRQWKWAAVCSRKFFDAWTFKYVNLVSSIVVRIGFIWFRVWRFQVNPTDSATVICVKCLIKLRAIISFARFAMRRTGTSISLKKI